MAFVRNSWYVGAFASEVSARPVTRIILGEQVCMYRGESGRVHAVHDLCPHRFASLHLGKVVGDEIQCPYHGMRLTGDGRCAHMPNNGGVVPSSVRVRSYPVEERYGSIWLWMGDPNSADRSLIPDFSVLADERFGFEEIYVHVAGNYQLFADNLLDLSHAEFLHPYFVEETDPGRVEYKNNAGSRTVECIFQQFDAECPGLYRANWANAPARIDALSTVVWTAPSFCVGRMMARPSGAAEWIPETGGANTHAMTPETETTTHYFYNGGFPGHLATPEYRSNFVKMAMTGFLGEDIGIIENIQKNIGARDLMSLRPALFKLDTSAVQARRAVDRLLASEADQNQVD